MNDSTAGTHSPFLGYPFFTTTAVILIILKLNGMMEMGWWWIILLPVYGPVVKWMIMIVMILLAVSILGVFIIIGSGIKSLRKKLSS